MLHQGKVEMTSMRSSLASSWTAGILTVAVNCFLDDEDSEEEKQGRSAQNPQTGREYSVRPERGSQHRGSVSKVLICFPHNENEHPQLFRTLPFFNINLTGKKIIRCNFLGFYWRLYSEEYWSGVSF